MLERFIKVFMGNVIFLCSIILYVILVVVGLMVVVVVGLLVCLSNPLLGLIAIILGVSFILTCLLDYKEIMNKKGKMM